MVRRARCQEQPYALWVFLSGMKSTIWVIDLLLKHT
jgi:hypothetical protein